MARALSASELPPPIVSVLAPAILVVDDDKMARHTLRHMLEHAGFTVILAAGGRQALRTFQERPIAAVVTDIMMPSMDGLRLIRELLTLQPDAGIVAISGAEKRLEVARQVGAKAVLRKPIEHADLVQAVRLVTAQSIAATEPVAG
ncbi:MAG TPA: response regulator [Stellaceae bacterium]|nr:response regulator [Stellaceae bacterium]